MKTLTIAFIAFSFNQVFAGGKSVGTMNGIGFGHLNFINNGQGSMRISGHNQGNFKVGNGAGTMNSSLGGGGGFRPDGGNGGGGGGGLVESNGGNLPEFQ